MSVQRFKYLTLNTWFSKCIDLLEVILVDLLFLWFKLICRIVGIIQVLL